MARFLNVVVENDDKMKTTIEFDNRYGYGVAMAKIDEGKWKLVLRKYPSWETYRVISENHDIKAIDPAGGPFIGIGFTIMEGEVVKRIAAEGKDYIFYTKEEQDDDY